MKLDFLYHGGAVGASGYLTLPMQETIEAQASVSVPINGGHASSRVEKFRHRTYFSFDSAESHVVGSFSERDQAYGTLATTTVEGLNIMDVVTCDRIVVRLTAKHPKDRSEPSFIALGSRFENLRIAGHPVNVELATDVFAEHSSWSRLSEAYKSKKEVKSALEKLSLSEKFVFPEDGGTIACTLARNLDNLPAGLSRKGHGIYVPHFGTVYLCEYFAKKDMHRLLMLHVDLGCSVEGCYGVGGGDGNGSWPPAG